MKKILGIAGAAFVAFSMTVTPTLAEGKTLVMGVTQSPRHLNGAITSSIATLGISTQIFASLVRYDDNWEPQPYLAKSWETSEDGKTVTFALVENALFHDGKPVTSKDVAYSLMITKKHHNIPALFGPVESIETPDKHTVILKLSKPHPALMLALSPAFSPILPKHLFDNGEDPKTNSFNSKPVGAGPFMVKEFVPNEVIVLEKNPNFFMEGRPKLDEIIVRIVQNPTALMIATEVGEVDLYPSIAGSQGINRLKKVERLAVTDKGYDAIGSINWLAFNTKSEKLSDPRVRRAIAYAIDRDFITKALHRGVSKPQRSPIFEKSPFFSKEAVETYDLDLDKAKTLLADAGYADGLKLTIDYIPPLTEQHQSVAEYMKSQLKKVGIDLVIRSSPDVPSWIGHVANFDFELTLDGVNNWGDPVIGVHRSYMCSNIKKGVPWSNTQQYCNEKVDEILNSAAVETDQKKRAELYAEFQKIITKDLPVYTLNNIPSHTAYDKRLQNPPVGIFGAMTPLDRLEWSE